MVLIEATRYVEHVMGMPITIDVRDSSISLVERTAAITDCMSWFHQVDGWFSTYKIDSQLNLLSRGEICLSQCAGAMGLILDRCEELRRETNGYFDVMATGRLDPSGLVKGWAVAQASSMLGEAGLRHHCINAGGDIVVAGCADDGRAWRVGIDHPLVTRALCAVVSVTDAAVATSGTAARGFHVVNPHTRRPATDLASVTMIGGDLGQADAYATAALAMGLDCPDWLETLTDYDSLVIDAEGHIWETQGFARHRVTMN